MTNPAIKNEYKGEEDQFPKPDVKFPGIRAQIEELKAEDVTKETVAHLVVLQMVDFALETEDLRSDENIKNLYLEYNSWLERDSGSIDESTSIPSSIALPVLAPVIAGLRNRALNLNADRRSNVSQALDLIAESMQDSYKPYISVGKFLCNAHLLGAIANHMSLPSEELEFYRNFEYRMLDIPLIKHFQDSFTIPRTRDTNRFAQAAAQWIKLKELSTGAETILGACLEFGLAILDYYTTHRYNPILIRTKDSFIDESITFKATTDTRTPNPKFVYLGRGWCVPLLYVSAASMALPSSKKTKNESYTTYSLNAESQNFSKFKDLMKLVRETSIRGVYSIIAEKYSINP